MIFNTQLLQIVITAWFGVAPVTITLPKLYPASSFECYEAATKFIQTHRPIARGKHGIIFAKRAEASCVQTDKRDI